MFVPFVSSKPVRNYRRRGGGGGGRGGSSSGGGKSGSGSSGGSKSGSGSSGSKGSSGSSSSGSRSGGSSSGSSSSSSRSSTSSIAGSTRSITPYSSGGGRIVTIPSGSLFSGRTAGGGTRSQVFGSRTYGSGYPGISGRGVAGRGFPFYFWPVVYGGVIGAGTGAYLHDNEYGHPDNSSRPGGVMMTTAFLSSTTNTTFHIVADNTTIIDLTNDIQSNCTSLLASNNTPTAYNSSAPDSPKPEQAIQYYRASSVVLTLDGYNNTAVFDAEGTADVPLPSGIDMNLLNCLNQTIGAGVPLVDADATGNSGITLTIPNCYGLLALIWLLWCFN